MIGIPFEINKEFATELFLKWIKKKHIRKKLRNEILHSFSLVPRYIPYWNFDTVYVEGEYEWKRGRDDQPEMEWTERSGHIRWVIHDLFIPALTTYNEYSLTKLSENFSANRFVTFDPDYSAGEIAKKPTIDHRKGWEEAKEQIYNRLEREVLSDTKIGPDEAKLTALNLRYTDVTQILVYVAVYLCTFQYRKSTYYIAIDGGDGTCIGSSPTSALRVLGRILFHKE